MALVEKNSAHFKKNYGMKSTTHGYRPARVWVSVSTTEGGHSRRDVPYRFLHRSEVHEIGNAISVQGRSDQTAVQSVEEPRGYNSLLSELSEGTGEIRRLLTIMLGPMGTG